MNAHELWTELLNKAAECAQKAEDFDGHGEVGMYGYHRGMSWAYKDAANMFQDFATEMNKAITAIETTIREQM